MQGKTYEFVDWYEYSENYLQEAFKNDTLQRFGTGEIEKIKSMIRIPEGGYADTYEIMFDAAEIFNTLEFQKMSQEKKVICFFDNQKITRYKAKEKYCAIHVAIFKDEDDYFLVTHHYELYDPVLSDYHDMRDVKCDQMRGLKDYFESQIFQDFVNMRYL